MDWHLSRDWNQVKTQKRIYQIEGRAGTKAPRSEKRVWGSRSRVHIHPLRSRLEYMVTYLMSLFEYLTVSQSNYFHDRTLYSYLHQKMYSSHRILHFTIIQPFLKGKSSESFLSLSLPHSPYTIHQAMLDVLPDNPSAFCPSLLPPLQTKQTLFLP